MKADQSVRVYRLDNGITLLGETMKQVSSAAMSILVPMGAVTDPEERQGSASILVEMFNKGGGPFNSKELSWEFEKLGAHRASSAGLEHCCFSCSALGENLSKIIPLYAKMLLEPHLPEEELRSVKDVVIQELKSLEDEPSSKVMVELSRRFYPEPFGRCNLGTTSGVEAVSGALLKKYYKEGFVANGTIIGVAGNFDWEEIKSVVEASFSSWKGSSERMLPGPLSKETRAFHLEQDTSQLQIALAYPSVAIDHDDYYRAKVAVGILSGGMAGRLFIEVREKRGLVYRVSASHNGALGRASVTAYAGTTPEHAQQTLSVMVRELKNLKNGVTDEELKRAKADIKSKMVIQLELSSARASRLTNDWWSLGEVRDLGDIKAAIDSVNNDLLCRHLDAYRVSPVTLVTLGPQMNLELSL
ncbi:MAG: insulinase family protein [Deltaproteobacteria bacterium]|nr:insulinase family protein [Deltaproteobacteria bacterium]